MRKIYIVFILIFGVFITLELSFKPQVSKPPFSDWANPHVTSVKVQQASVLNFTDFYAEDNKSRATTITTDELTWNLLGKISYVNKPHKDYPDGVMFPVINSELKAKKGKKITISGFIIPIDNTSYALSKNVFAQCFFCGQAGPETIMGIQFKDLKKRLKTDQYVTLVGTFRYNDNDVEDWIYHIDEAVIVKGG